MRAVWVAGLGGLLVGHILWLAGISVAIETADVSRWVLVVAAASLLLGVAAGLAGRRAWLRRAPNWQVWAAFWWALPVSPVLLSLTVLGVTYL
ncbi:hypothetical protein [Mycolicibacterium vaccae]|uniref:hypothetical protein n=1 Tax=Mycolicibacterium vaccae TaxID=1810 RepID=UPI003D00A268